MRLTTTALACALAAAGASAADAQTCEPADVQANLQYLRRLSLDLRGRIPAVAELSSIVTNGAVDPAIVDEMVDSEAFVEQMRRHHRDLLWTNVRDRRIVQNVWILRGPNLRRGETAFAIRAAQRMIAYRGAAGVSCLDEPARFDPDTGEILTTPSAEDPDIQQEGWVEVAPYWDPSTTIRVCAFDAQDALTAIDPRNGREVDCRVARNVRGCGCGPNLRWCQAIAGDGVNTLQAILGSMNEQLLRFTDDVVREDRPYTDVLLAKDMEINGPLVHWLRHQSQTGLNLLPALPEQNHPLPEIEWTDDWVRIERGTRHAGVLSMPGYLVKFQSNRGRANRFYNAFLCQHFESSNPLPPATDECHQEPDLTKRCGCKDCHQALEPAAGHWGRWAEAGLLPLEEPLFPTYNPTCAGDGGRDRAGAGLCNLFYFTPRDVTNPEVETPYVGMLRAYVFADDQTQANIEAGPEKIAREAVDGGAFASCTVTKVWTRLMAREPTVDELEVIDAIAEDFATDYSMKRLVKTLVTRPEYVEAGMFGPDAKE